MLYILVLKDEGEITSSSQTLFSYFLFLPGLLIRKFTCKLLFRLTYTFIMAQIYLLYADKPNSSYIC